MALTRTMRIEGLLATWARDLLLAGFRSCHNKTSVRAASYLAHRRIKAVQSPRFLTERGGTSTVSNLNRNPPIISWLP